MTAYRLGRMSLIVASLLVASATAAPPKAMAPKDRLDKSSRHHEWVNLPSEAGSKLRAVVVFPEVDRPVPAVVVIHENRGLNAWARSLADQVAEAGYVAIAPDMLSGKGPQGGGTDSYESEDAAREAIYQLSDEVVRQHLDAAVKYVRGLDATTDKVAVGGFCWGGGKTFDYAAHNPNIAAAFVFYGPAPDEARLKEIKVRVHGFYGGNDHRITGQVPQTETTMKRLNKIYKPVVYDQAGHGFMRSGEMADASDADRKARDQAWERLQQLLKALQ